MSFINTAVLSVSIVLAYTKSNLLLVRNEGIGIPLPNSFLMQFLILSFVPIG